MCFLVTIGRYHISQPMCKLMFKLRVPNIKLSLRVSNYLSTGNGSFFINNIMIEMGQYELAFVVYGPYVLTYLNISNTR